MNRALITHSLCIGLLAITTYSAHADAFADTPHLYQDIQSRVKTLTHSIDTYSWSNATKLGANASSDLSATDPRGKSFVQNHLNSFQNSTSDNPHDSVGEGLYLASDPVATLYYGGNTNWVLIKVPFQIGTKFFDLRDANTGQGLTLSPASLQEVKALSCPAATYFDLAQIGACRKILVNIIDALNVDLIAYTYTTMQFNNLPHRSDTSFVLASDKNLVWDKFRVFTSSLPSSPDPDSDDRSIIETSFVKMIAPTWLTAGQADLAAFLLSLQPWPQIAPMNESTWISYLSQHFFDAGTSSEDHFVPFTPTP